MASTDSILTRPKSADVQITGVLDMRGFPVSGLSTDLSQYPTTDDEAATKVYVDSTRETILNGLPVSVDNGVY